MGGKILLYQPWRTQKIRMTAGLAPENYYYLNKKYTNDEYST